MTDPTQNYYDLISKSEFPYYELVKTQHVYPINFHYFDTFLKDKHLSILVSSLIINIMWLGDFKMLKIEIVLIVTKNVIFVGNRL